MYLYSADFLIFNHHSENVIVFEKRCHYIAYKGEMDLFERAVRFGVEEIAPSSAYLTYHNGGS